MIQTIKLHSKQWAALNCPKQFIAVICGIQSGKTFLGCVWAQKKINEFPKANGLIAAPTYKILNQSTLEKFFQIFPQYFPLYRQQQSVIELPTGGKIFIRSVDDPKTLEGMTLRWAWLDEAGQANRMVYQIMRSRVSTTGGQILFTTTPYSLNWLYNDLYLRWKNGEDSDLEVFTWRSIENPYFPKDFYEKEKKRLSPQEFARRYDGEFTKIEGLVYDLPQSKIIAPVSMNYEIIIGGVDWGFHAPAAIWIGGMRDRIFYTIDEWYETEKTTAEIIAQMQEFQRNYKVNRWYADSAEPDRIREAQKAGLYVLKGTKDIKGRISKVNQLIRENRFFVFNNCKNFLEEINCYHFSDDGKDIPEKGNDHLMNAMEYAIGTYEPIISEVTKKMERIFEENQMRKIITTR